VEILGVGPLEVLLIAILALVLFGPKDIARNTRSAGRFLSRLYKSEGWRTMQDASAALRNLPNRLAREAELEELETVRRQLEETARAGPPATEPPQTGGMTAWIPGGSQPPSSGSSVIATKQSPPSPRSPAPD
jgi:Sec-independent protein translocase protein TatA